MFGYASLVMLKKWTDHMQTSILRPYKIENHTLHVIESHTEKVSQTKNGIFNQDF